MGRDVSFLVFDLENCFLLMLKTRRVAILPKNSIRRDTELLLS